MRASAIAVLGVLACLLLLTTVAGAWGGRGRVYGVSQVIAGLSRDPRAWVGRTVLVRGVALRLLPGCGAGQWCLEGLYEPAARRRGPILLLEPGPADSLVARLRRVPILDGVAPRPQRLRGAVAIYRVRFQAAPRQSCDARPCVTAILVDAAPPSARSPANP